MACNQVFFSLMSVTIKINVYLRYFDAHRKATVNLSRCINVYRSDEIPVFVIIICHTIRVINSFPPGLLGYWAFNGFLDFSGRSTGFSTRLLNPFVSAQLDSNKDPPTRVQRDMSLRAHVLIWYYCDYRGYLHNRTAW